MGGVGSVVVPLAALGSVMFTGSGCGEELGDLKVWHSDTDEIGRWGKKASDIPSAVYIDDLSSSPVSEFPFTAAMSHAIAGWRDALGNEMNGQKFASEKPPSGAKIVYFGGTAADLRTRAEFRSVDFDDIFLKERTISSSQKEGTWKYKEKEMKGIKYKKVTGFVRKITSNNDVDYYKYTAIHELGHALGWNGHSSDSSDSSDVMFSGKISITTLTSNDINHLKQIYK